MRSNAVGGDCTLGLAWEVAIMMPLHPVNTEDIADKYILQ